MKLLSVKRRVQPVSTCHGESLNLLGYLVPSQLKRESWSFIIKKCRGLELQLGAVDRNWAVVLEWFWVWILAFLLPRCVSSGCDLSKPVSPSVKWAHSTSLPALQICSGAYVKQGMWKLPALWLVHSQHSINIFSSSIPLLQLTQYLFPAKKKKSLWFLDVWISCPQIKPHTLQVMIRWLSLTSLEKKWLESKRQKQKERKRKGEKKKKEKGFQGRR